ncbi:hypothetical protein [Agrococcus sp. ARC_14]|nr:hypothetical protein [Agrococcus sp. ARC_14]MCH1883826.1 hypothetical protein [Agrococcus sp. ARC_14]
MKDGRPCAADARANFVKACTKADDAGAAQGWVAEQERLTLAETDLE